MSAKPLTPAIVPDNTEHPRDLRFWLVFLALFVCGFITALEMGVISASLPTIVDDLQGTQFIWVGSAYALAATALIPFSGGLAQLFGRRPVLLASVILFAVGSVVCGAAKNLNMLIAGRTIQGLGGGGMISLSQIVLADLVPLRDRGSFNGLITIAYALGCGISPVVGGKLAAIGQWRWIFYLNVPICGVAAALVSVFLRLRTPAGTLGEKLRRIDYIGNILVIGATTSTVLALSWGGIQFSWNSANILAPLIIGLLGLGLFLVYEARFASNPMVPLEIISTRTGLSGYAQTFFNSMILITVIYYIEAYFQACYNVSPTAAGVDGLGMGLVASPFGFFAGIVIQKTHSYRVPLWIGWIFVTVGSALLSTLNADSPRAASIGYLVITSVGMGIVILGSYFPVLAPVSVTKNAHALSFLVFLRNFSGVWGVTIGGTVLQNQLRKKLPAEFVAQFPGGVEIAYAAIPVIGTLEEPLRTQVRNAFADSFKAVWWVTTGIAGLGLLFSLAMKHYPLHTAVDKDWGFEEAELSKANQLESNLHAKTNSNESVGQNEL
ncbi:iron permease [Favolaschia claudopus]|uniref:Iron permease n=1 Tax=Favolaschia claudopus TaxID=2862362 RepID=A0AAW0DH66_9AGAR